MQNAQLKVLNGPLAGTVLPIDSYTAVLGRGSESSFGLSGYEEMSRRHAIIRWDGTGWLLEDQQSRNGSEVDGAVAPIARLVPGSHIKLGDFEAEFLCTPQQPGMLMKKKDARKIAGGLAVVLAALFILWLLAVKGYRLIENILHPKPVHTFHLPSTAGIHIPPIGAGSQATPALNGTPAPVSGANAPSGSSPSLLPNSPATADSGGNGGLPGIAPVMLNSQALVRNHDNAGNWFKTGAGLLISPNIVAVPTSEVVNHSNQVVDVQIILGSSAPYTKYDVPPSSIAVHGDVAIVTLPGSANLQLPPVGATTASIQNQNIEMELMDANAGSSSVHLRRYQVIWTLVDNQKSRQYIGFEVNYHAEYNYLGAPVFDTQGNLIGMMAGERNSEVFHKNMAYGYTISYLQSLLPH